MLGQAAPVSVRFQNSQNTDVSAVVEVQKSWTWAELIAEIGKAIDVSSEKITHLVLLNKSGSEISLQIGDFSKFKRILTMYTNPDDMRFSVFLSKSEQPKNLKHRFRFQLQSNSKRNLDISINEGATWKDITHLITDEFSSSEPIDHVVLMNREGEHLSKELKTSDSFWAAVPSFDINDCVFVAMSCSGEPSADASLSGQPLSPARGLRSPSWFLRSSPRRVKSSVMPAASPPRASKTEEIPASPSVSVSNADSISRPLEGSGVETPPADTAASPPIPPGPKQLKFPDLDLQEKTQETIFDDSSVPPAQSLKKISSSTTQKSSFVDKAEIVASGRTLVKGSSPPRAFQGNSLPSHPVEALFCLCDDLSSTVRVVLSDFESWAGILDPVSTAFGINSECILYFQLLDKENDELSPFLRNTDKFWRIYTKRYSLTNSDKKKFMVEIDPTRRFASESFSVSVQLTEECRHLSPSSPVQSVMFLQSSDWDGLSASVTTGYNLPNARAHHFIVLDSDGDEISPHLTTVEAFWKAISTFARDCGDSLAVHFDEIAVQDTLKEKERQLFLESAARFKVALDCDKSNSGECLVGSDGSWADIVRSIVSALSLTNGSALSKLVLTDTDGLPISPDITTDKKFWKIYNIKYKASPESVFLCTFKETSRQKAFFNLCVSGTQTASLQDLIKKGVDVNDICAERTIIGVDPSFEFSGVHLAAAGGHTATLRVLCSIDCLNIQCKDSIGRTPLFLACHSGVGECMELLIDKGANFRCRDNEGKTPLHVLALQGFEVPKNHEQRLQAMLKDRIDVEMANAFDENLMTPLMYSCKKGDYVVSKALIENGAIVNLRDKEGMSPLMHCVMSGSYQLLTYLLQQDPNSAARNNKGEDALLLTALTNNQRMAECLLGRQMDIQTRNYIGQSLYQVAVASSSQQIAQWFLKKGAGKASLSSKAQRHLFQTDQSLEKRLRADEIKHAELILGCPINVYTESVVSVLPSDVIEASSKLSESKVVSSIQKKNLHSKIQNLAISGDSTDKSMVIKSDLFNACMCGDIDRVREICRIVGDSVDICNIQASSGETLLHIACYTNNLELCKFLLRQGMSVTVRDISGYTPFHAACEEGLLDIVSWMVAVGAPCAITDKNMMMPIHYACQRPRSDVIKQLLSQPDCLLAVKDGKHMAAINYITGWTNVPDSDIEEILLHILQSGVPDLNDVAAILLPDAAFRGLAGVVDYILSMGCCSINVKCPEDGQSAMHRACKGAQLEVAKLLVRRKVDMTLRDNTEMTPFLHACSSGSLDLVKYLASCGPNDILTPVDYNGDNALHFCTRNHDTEMVKWLLQRGLDCNQPNHKKCAAVDLPEASDWSELKLVYREHQMTQVAPRPKDRLHVSYADWDAMAIYNICNSGSQDEIYALLGSGDNLDSELDDGSGYTALHIACERGNFGVVKMLTKNGCHFNRESRNGETPLCVACRTGSLNIAKHLVDLGVDMHEPVVDSTLLHVAVSNGNLQIASWLVEQGMSVETVDAAGFSAIHICARDNNFEGVQLLLSLGADAGVVGISAPLHVACFLGNLEVAKLLFAKKADPGSLHEGRNAFLISCSGGQLEVAKWLYSVGCDVNQVSEDGLTALHRACMVENIELADWLSEVNPSFIRSRAVDGRSALSVSVLTCNDDLVDLCERRLIESAEESVALEEIRDDIIDLLSVALYEMDFSIAPFMLQRLLLHTDPNYSFSDGCTTLHFAAAVGDLETISYLISHHAKLNACSDVGKTPLHYAAITGQIESADALIKAGADCAAKDVAGRDALDFGRYFKQKKFIKWLRNNPTYIEANAPKSSFFFACLPVGNNPLGQLDDDSDEIDEISSHSTDRDDISITRENS